MEQHHTAKVFSLTGSDLPVEAIITKLKFLGKIESGEKLNVKQLFVRGDNDSVYQKALRTVRQLGWGGESKEETLEFIKIIINEAIDLICVYNADPSDDFKRNIASMIVQNLKESKRGLLALIGTYSTDKRYVSNIEAVVETMDARVNALMSAGQPAGQPAGLSSAPSGALERSSTAGYASYNNVPPSGPPPPVPSASYSSIYPKPAPQRHPALDSDLEQE